MDQASSLGGDIPPVRYVLDPYPTFNGIAVDPENNKVFLSDENRKSALVYERTAGSLSDAMTRPWRHIIGPDTGMGFVSGVEVDPARREYYILNNDIEDQLVVFDYDAQGNQKPKRKLYVPHQAWGVTLNRETDEMAVSVQQLAAVAIYKREARRLEPPLRIIKGPRTGMADTHGIHWDTVHREIVVANHGNYSVITAYSAYDRDIPQIARTLGGHFRDPSLTVFADSAQGDAKPLRTIAGARTRLNWPMGLDVDAAHQEIAVANNGDASVLVFRRTAEGDVAPLRVLRGPRTGMDGPVDVAFDTRNDELWVANYADHTALVFPRAASGNAAPKRIIRNAPAGTPTGGFSNPYAVAYDSKRDELLVPN